MKEEVSAGIILFNEIDKRKFLLLNYPSKHWDFVKGKMEKDETPHETAIRETKEETGISDVEFIDGFEEEIEYYFYADNQEIHKKVIFFLGKTERILSSFYRNSTSLHISCEKSWSSVASFKYAK